MQMHNMMGRFLIKLEGTEDAAKISDFASWPILTHVTHSSRRPQKVLVGKKSGRLIKCLLLFARK